MSPEQAREFLRHHHHAVMATFRSDGRPQLSPVAAGVDAQGRVIISSRETAIKVKNLRRDPRVSLCAISDRFYGDWVQVEGEVEIVSLPEAMDGLEDYFRRLAGEHEDWDEYRAAMRREQRCLVRFEISRAGPTVAG